MKFQIKNISKSINDIMRAIGYKPAYFQNEGETSIVRQIGRNDYPRFHLYIKPITENGKSFGTAVPQDKWRLNAYVFNLHLDQKKPSYEGSRGHSGEYDGPVVEEEVKRIKELLVALSLNKNLLSR